MQSYDTYTSFLGDLIEKEQDTPFDNTKFIIPIGSEKMRIKLRFYNEINNLDT